MFRHTKAENAPFPILDDHLLSGEWSVHDGKLHYGDTTQLERHLSYRQENVQEARPDFNPAKSPDPDLPVSVVHNDIPLRRRRSNQTAKIFQYNGIICARQIEAEINTASLEAVSLKEELEQRRKKTENELGDIKFKLTMATEQLRQTKTSLDKLVENTKFWERIGQRANQRADPGKCSLCETNPVNIVLIPCGHCFLCHECLEPFQAAMKSCAICRKIYTQTQRFYS